MHLRGCGRETRPLIIGGLFALAVLALPSQQAEAGYRGLTDEHMAGYIDSTRVVTIDHGLGGRVQGMLHMLVQLARKDRQVVIDGPCKSACTMLMSLGPSRVCLTDRAEMWFHQASLHGGKRSRFWTTAMFDLYPPAVQDYLRRNGGLRKDWIKLKGTQLRKLFPSRCDGDARGSVRSVETRRVPTNRAAAWARISPASSAATEMFSGGQRAR